MFGLYLFIEEAVSTVGLFYGATIYGVQVQHEPLVQLTALEATNIHNHTQPCCK